MTVKDISRLLSTNERREGDSLAGSFVPDLEKLDRGEAYIPRRHGGVATLL